MREGREENGGVSGGINLMRVYEKKKEEESRWKIRCCRSTNVYASGCLLISSSTAPLQFVFVCKKSRKNKLGKETAIKKDLWKRKKKMNWKWRKQIKSYEKWKIQKMKKDRNFLFSFCPHFVSFFFFFFKFSFIFGFFDLFVY